MTEGGRGLMRTWEVGPGEEGGGGERGKNGERGAASDSLATRAERAPPGLPGRVTTASTATATCLRGFSELPFVPRAVPGGRHVRIYFGFAGAAPE